MEKRNVVKLESELETNVSDAEVSPFQGGFLQPIILMGIKATMNGGIFSPYAKCAILKFKEKLILKSHSFLSIRNGSNHTLLDFTQASMRVKR